MRTRTFSFRLILSAAVVFLATSLAHNKPSIARISA